MAGELVAGDASLPSMGGKARAAKMTPAERSASARKAAEARWMADLPRATHAGVLKLGNAEIQCVVLEDGRRLLTQETFLLAIGRSPRPKAGTGITGGEEQLDKLPSFLAAKHLKPFVAKELLDSTTAVAYRTLQDKKGYGFIATLLPEVCRVYIAAAEKKVLWKSQAHVAVACRVLHDSLADVAIISLVDEATGYQYERPRMELQEFLAMYINKRLAAWEPTFPADFYREIYRLQKWKYDPTCSQRTPLVGKMTNDLVYARLAPFVLDELKRITPRDEKGRLKHKYHQRLTRNHGIPELNAHFKELLAIMRGYDDWQACYRHISRALPRQPQHPDLFTCFAEGMGEGILLSSSNEPQPPAVQSLPAARG